MKTTLDLNDALLVRAKHMAARQRISLTRLIEEGLQLRMQTGQDLVERVRLPVFPGNGGLTPGLDGLSNKAMFNAAGREA